MKRLLSRLGGAALALAALPASAATSPASAPNAELDEVVVLLGSGQAQKFVESRPTYGEEGGVTVAFTLSDKARVVLVSREGRWYLRDWPHTGATPSAAPSAPLVPPAEPAPR